MKDALIETKVNIKKNMDNKINPNLKVLNVWPQKIEKALIIQVNYRKHLLKRKINELKKKIALQNELNNVISNII